MDELVPPDVGSDWRFPCCAAGKNSVLGPMAAVRVGLVGDDFIINPTYAEIEAGDLDLIVAGSPEGVIMVRLEQNQLPGTLLKQLILATKRYGT